MAKNAYEKMFEDGTAFQPIKIDQPSPDNEQGKFGTGADTGADPDIEVDYSLFDDHMDNMMKEKIEAKKTKVLGEETPVKFTGDLSPQPPAQSNKIVRLEKRIELLEQALGLVMETQTKLMRG
jgi:hypothetical protein